MDGIWIPLREVNVFEKTAHGVEDEDQGFYSEWKYMEVLANCSAWKVITNLGVSMRMRKIREGLVTQGKCSNYMAEDWSLTRASWKIISSSMAIEGVLRKGLSNMQFLNVFYETLCWTCPLPLP